ncbi:MAG TPA: helix-turn-helix domain-containing protein [Thermoleophilaceae bacterium]
MPPAEQRVESAANPGFFDAVADVSEAVESGAGLPEVARAVSRALDASVAVVDASTNVLAVACASPDDERAVLSRGEVLELRVADAPAGQLRYRPRGAPPPAALLRLLGTLIAQEVERSKAPGRASEAAAAAFLADLLDRRVTDRENIVARGHELGADLAAGGSVLVIRGRRLQATEGDWRARVLAIVDRGVRGVARGYLSGVVEVKTWARGQQRAHEPEIVLLVPGDDDVSVRAVQAIQREIEASLPGFAVSIARSRAAADPADLHRAGAEAFLAANVAAAHGADELAFEETGAYRLLLPAMIEDPQELRRFHEETVAPLVAYDEQYETELVRTLESFLDADGNVAQTAQRLYTHRHTVRYRLERVRELTGLDVSSTDGRERLGLGLKAMRVLGILAPHGPATEAGAEGGRVPREEKDR